ncbi:methyltransferase domain-containing protein, partial [Patescibacteria group bacterium]|nr:methyltransferase domain-containing protein [Patescibacteria group bacterium]
MSKKKVIDYYKKTLIDYQLIYFRNRNYAMNYGYWDETVKNRDEALLKLNSVIADKLKITKKDFVLDAGCGLGATSFWLAKNIGCRVEGVSIAPNQIKIAQELANKNGLQTKIKFKTLDYTNTSYPNNHFDVVIAIETICHLEDKNDFYREMYRILKPSGRLLVAEAVLKKPKMSQTEKKELRFMLDGWAVPNLWTREQHKRSIQNLGFIDVSLEDYSNNIIKTSQYLYTHSIYGLPIYRLLNKLKVLNKVR